MTESVMSICPGCGVPVVSYWETNGCVSNPDYDLIADTIWHAKCWAAVMKSIADEDVELAYDEEERNRDEQAVAASSVRSVAGESLD
jgi:predicted  nucleic acid-binding Zn-ribbon protein